MRLRAHYKYNIEYLHRGSNKREYIIIIIIIVFMIIIIISPTEANTELYIIIILYTRVRYTG